MGGMSYKETWNDAIERAALEIETMHGNQIYAQAWRKAAKRVRDLKVLIDGSEQISSSSSRPVPEASPAGRLVSKAT